MKPFLSKLEITQYLSKLYNLEIESVHTVNKMGKILRNTDTGTYWRKKDWKKAIVKVDFDVDKKLQHPDG